MSRILFQLTALAATGFVITILSTVAMLLGDPAAPLNVWFNQHGTTVLMSEVAAVVLLGLSAMTADRRETLRAKPPTETTDVPSTDPNDCPPAVRRQGPVP